MRKGNRSEQLSRDLKTLMGIDENKKVKAVGSEGESSQNVSQGTRLERLAELINKRWPRESKAKVYGDDCLYLVEFDYLSKYADPFNAEFIVWGIERLSELGMTPCISVHAVGYTLAYGTMPDVVSWAGGRQIETYPEGCLERRSVTAKRLAEAIANALAVALEHAPATVNPEPNESEETTTNEEVK